MTTVGEWPSNIDAASANQRGRVARRRSRAKAIRVARCATSWVAGIVLFVSGCNDRAVPPEFVYDERTETLLPEARDAVKTTLRESFGTPDELVAWLKLPLEFGTHDGKVASGESTIASFVVESPDEILPPSGTGLVWLTGSQAGKTSQIAGFDADTNRLTLVEPLGMAPAEGDEFTLSGAHLQNGRVVYMKHCMHCHGISGDGKGPTAKYMTPKPRDYRLGIFKFTSTGATDKASRDDLRQIVQEGIPGTYMPSFLLLGDQDLHDVIEYVRFLAMRGELEKRLVDEMALDFSQEALQEMIDDEKADFAEDQADYEEAKAAGEEVEAPDPLDLDAVRAEMFEELEIVLEEDFPYMVEDAADYLVDAWSEADEEEAAVVPSVPRVADTPASRLRGRELYLSDKTKCYTCHGIHGRGDGQAIDDYWAKPGSSDKYNEPGLHDIWGNVLPPRNLTRGQYRGGRRPLDVYRRLYAGIKGTPMPAFGGTTLKDEEIWDLVNFVMNLPFEEPSAVPSEAAEPPAVEVTVK